jgi:hypothetical protein
LEQRELHADERVLRPTPADARIEDVRGFLGEISGDIEVGNLAPAMRLGDRQSDILPSERKAYDKDEDEPGIEPRNAEFRMLNAEF